MVNQNFALWKRIKGKSRDGTPIMCGTASLIDTHYKGKLLARILDMPIKNPITLDEAINIIRAKMMDAFNAGDIGMKPGQYCWYPDNFVSYISDLGYHIELTGDEIETLGPVSEVRT